MMRLRSQSTISDGCSQESRETSPVHRDVYLIKFYAPSKSTTYDKKLIAINAALCRRRRVEGIAESIRIIDELPLTA